MKDKDQHRDDMNEVQDQSSNNENGDIDWDQPPPYDVLFRGDTGNISNENKR